MTRSNLHIILTNGRKIKCVADSSSAPEQGYIIENLLQPLLEMNSADEEIKLIREHCTMDEQRSNATYRYEINLLTKRVSFFEEGFNDGTGRFTRGENITERYEKYLRTIKR